MSEGCSHGSNQDNQQNQSQEGDDQTGNRQAARRTEYAHERQNQTQYPENPSQHGNPGENQAQQCEHETGRTYSVRFLFSGLVDDIVWPWFSLPCGFCTFSSIIVHVFLPPAPRQLFLERRRGAAVHFPSRESRTSHSQSPHPGSPDSGGKLTSPSTCCYKSTKFCELCNIFVRNRTSACTFLFETAAKRSPPGANSHGQP